MKRWIRKLFPTTSHTISRRDRLAVLTLEDRTTPTVGATISGGGLAVTLSGSTDQVVIGGVAANGTTVNVSNVGNFSNVSRISVTNTPSVASQQAVNFLDATTPNNLISLSGAVTVNDINTVVLSNSVNPLKAGTITLNCRFLSQATTIPELSASKISITANRSGHRGYYQPTRREVKCHRERGRHFRGDGHERDPDGCKLDQSHTQRRHVPNCGCYE